jgi:phenylalanyl-tRNA synthetase beta chain
MTSRLALAGMRSISLVVDVTNYVMLELGQPIHGYDLGALSGGLVVRRARPGETLETLDGQERTLHEEDLLITDGSGPIGLAGVMGGASTEIGSTTSDVLIEAANFDPVSVARSARRHKLPSEASRRFERGVDPAVAAPAAERVVQLLEELAGGTADALGSSFDVSVAAEAILLPDGFISALIGVDYTDAEIRSCLEAIGCVVVDGHDALSVTPPTWRPDLVDRGTLAEEVVRITGYDRIPAVLPTAPPGHGLTREQRLRRSVSQQLAAGGATEVIGSPFVSRVSAERFVEPSAETPAPAIRLANPLDAEAPFLRTSLIPGLLDVARRNLSRGLVDLAVFEVGAVFLPLPGVAYGSGPLPTGGRRPSDEVLAALDAGIPPQPRHAAGLVTGMAVEQQAGQPAVPAGVADALTAVRRIGAALALEIAVRQSTRPSLHPGRTAELLVGDEVVGVAGELLPQLAAELDLPRVVAVWELDLDALVRLAPTEVLPQALSSFPAATQDLSLVVPVAVPAGEVRAAVVEGAGALLEDARIVDDYRDVSLRESGVKSITLGLRFRAPDRTLTAQEATDAKLAGVALATSRFGAQLRE